jgi:hypothetical protein
VSRFDGAGKETELFVMRLVVIKRNGEEELVYFQLACDLPLALRICEGGEVLWEAAREGAESQTWNEMGAARDQLGRGNLHVSAVLNSGASRI